MECAEGDVLACEIEVVRRKDNQRLMDVMVKHRWGWGWVRGGGGSLQVALLAAGEVMATLSDTDRRSCRGVPDAEQRCRGSCWGCCRGGAAEGLLLGLLPAADASPAAAAAAAASAAADLCRPSRCSGRRIEGKAAPGKERVSCFHIE